MNHQPYQPPANNALLGVDLLRSLLKEEEVTLAARYLGLEETQQMIADHTHTPQTTVSYRLRRIVAKLNAAGIPLKLKGKGRRPSVTARPRHMRSATTKQLDRMLTGQDDGRLRGRWIDAPKIDQPRDSGGGSC